MAHFRASRAPGSGERYLKELNDAAERREYARRKERYLQQLNDRTSTINKRPEMIEANTSITRAPKKGEVYRTIGYGSNHFDGSYIDAVVVSDSNPSGGDDFICKVVHTSGDKWSYMKGQLINLIGISGVMKIAATLEDYKDMDDYVLPVKEVIKEVELIKEVEVIKEVIVEKEVYVYVDSFIPGAVYRCYSRNSYPIFFDVLVDSVEGTGTWVYDSSKNGWASRHVVGDRYKITAEDLVSMKVHIIANNITDYHYKPKKPNFLDRIFYRMSGKAADDDYTGYV